jgi:radical SAM protein with 4Fe4S-binding SPASM domain
VCKNETVYGLPISVSVEPVSFCNLHCPQCPVGNGTSGREAGMMTINQFEKIISKLAPSTSYLNLYFQGEPLLHPEFSKMAEIAHKNKIYTSSSTNGQKLDDEMARKLVLSGLNKLIISIDGTNQETYEKYRQGGSLNKVLDGISALVKWKKQLQSKTPIIELQFLVFSHNEHQIQEMKTLHKKLFADVLSFKTAQIYDSENAKEFLPKISKYARYKTNKDGTLQRKKKMRNSCWRSFSSVVIAYNGDVLPCSFDKKGEFVFGNIFEESLQTIWKSEKAAKFRKSILTNRAQCYICTNCVS